MKMLSPFRGFRDLQSEMERLFSETFGWLPQATAETGWTPAVDVLTRGGDLIIRAELPGVRREDVEVAVSNGVLTISGKRKEEEEREQAGYLIRERRQGSFRRSMALPEGVNEDEIKATFRDGVLEVTVPGGGAAVETSPRRIEIEG